MEIIRDIPTKTTPVRKSLTYCPTNTGNIFSPPVLIEEIWSESKRYFVVRDDVLPGGSKQRACYPLLENYVEQGFETFYYASPFAGFAQVALAYTSSKMGRPCHLYCEMDPNQKTEYSMHEFTRLAQSYGATITMTRSLSEAEELCASAAKSDQAAIKIPLGFNCDEFRRAFKIELELQWASVKNLVGYTPKRLWLPVGSGTLASVFDQVLDEETLVNCVNVRVLSNSDARIQKLIEHPRVQMFTTPETFHRKAETLPNIPSNVHYDAKIWQFLARYGQNDDVWWNVAR